MALDWHLIAQEQGFDRPETMFKTWYNDEGWTLSEIAYELGCSTWTVRSAFVKFGISLRQHGGLRRKKT